MKQAATLFKTTDHWAGLITRLTLAIVILPHGAQQLLGWYGGFGYAGTMDYYQQQAGLPWIIAFLVIFLQSFGAIAVLLGFASRLLAVSLAILFIGMIVTVHLDQGFFMNWFGNQTGEGYEYHLLVIGLSLILLVSGAGKYSMDYRITRNLNRVNQAYEFAN